MSKEEILESKFSFGFVGMESDHIYKAMDEYAKLVAIGFAEWLYSDEDGIRWEQYDGHDRWINLKTDEVLETKQLYQQYLNQRGNDLRQGNEVKD